MVENLVDSGGNTSVDFLPAGPLSRSELLTVPMNTARKLFRVITPAVAGAALLLPVWGTAADVLVGEVWLCAGQANMEFRCGGQPFSNGNLTNSAGLPTSMFLLNVAP